MGPSEHGSHVSFRDDPQALDAHERTRRGHLDGFRAGGGWGDSLIAGGKFSQDALRQVPQRTDTDTDSDT